MLADPAAGSRAKIRALIAASAVLLVGALAQGCAGTQRPDPSSLSPEAVVAHIFYTQPESPDHRIASGTGFVIRSDGLMVTAAHVVAEHKLIDVRFSGFEGDSGDFHPARVITIDVDRDVALLKFDPADTGHAATPTHLARKPARIGDPVTVFGFPESNIVGLEMRRTSGAISAWRHNPLNRDDESTRMLELEAKIEPGNSGSPVFNDRMEVVGVVSSRWETTDSYALAAPISVVRDLLESRYEDDLSAARAELEAMPETFLTEIRQARELAQDMRGLFPEGSEGAQRVAELEARMDEAMAEGQLGVEALERRDYALASRHLHLMRYKAEVHRQDVALLKAARRALIAGQE